MLKDLLLGVFFMVNALYLWPGFYNLSQPYDRVAAILSIANLAIGISWVVLALTLA